MVQQVTRQFANGEQVTVVNRIISQVYRRSDGCGKVHVT